jgi:MFS family permease
MNQAPDPVFSAFLDLADWMRGDGGESLKIVLFGGILGSIYSILQFIFSPIWGRLSDRIGRRKVLLLTCSGNLLGYVVWLFSASFSGFILSRVITGAMGGNISVASAAMADSTSDADRAKGMGMIGAGIGLGFIFGPLLGGVLSGIELVDLFPVLSGVSFTIFSTSALVSILVAFLNLLFVILFLKETYSKQKNEESRESGSDTPIYPIFLILKEKYRGLLLISGIYFFFIYSFSGFEFTLNFFLNEEFHFSPKQIGFTFLYIGVIIILIQGGLIRRISGKVPEKKIAFSGLGLLLVGYLGLVFHFEMKVLFFIGLGLLAVGSALLHPSLSSLASLGAKREEQGLSLGIFRGFGSLARGLSPISFAFLYFQTSAAMVFLSGIGFAVLVIGLLTIPSRKISARTEIL